MLRYRRRGAVLLGSPAQRLSNEERNVMKTTFAIIGFGMILLLSGCVSPPGASVTIAPVGPYPGVQQSGSGFGKLEVFSRLSVRTDDQNQGSRDEVWHQHTDYYLCDTGGKALKLVFNAPGHYGRDPRILNLRAGRYIVEAQSAPNYWVRVPVLIIRGATTNVHLDGNWSPLSYADKTQVVTMPDGRPVGWAM